MTPLTIFVIVVLAIIAFGLLRSVRMIQWRRAVVLRLDFCRHIAESWMVSLRRP